ncbi:MAG TPA: pseudouridine synthase [Patescibacteria group bacterium]|nr:pseudouridine synthase [Patescibacteria group bacterium]
MRINKFIALGTGMSRRAADGVVASGHVQINGTLAQNGQEVQSSDTVTLYGRPVETPEATQTVILNKPAGYVVSREGQGSKTIYDLLPPELGKLKPVGRLDKDSSGLLLLTNDGELAQRLTHPSYKKAKIYEVTLSKPLESHHERQIAAGVELSDGVSRLKLEKLGPGYKTWRVTMHEGRNRQIRRTFIALGYSVTKLHRTHFGAYTLSSTLAVGSWQAQSPSPK